MADYVVMMNNCSIFKITILLFWCLQLGTAQAQLFASGDFENGPGGGCGCVTGFTCGNDAGRVIDGTHPVFAVGNNGCVTGATNYAPQLGAHGGSCSVYFYAGLDNIQSPTVNFSGGEEVCLSVWYCGPQGSGASGQNTSNAHFSFGLDGSQIGPDVQVPVGTGWTEHTFTVIMTGGNHTFSVLSGGAAQYSIWFDDFNANLCSAPCDASWTTTSACSTDGPINLDGLITGDTGGTWSGTGVTGNSFNPSSGTQSITYTAPGGCNVTQDITVNTTAIATWTVPSNLCTNDSPVDLSLNITGTTGGTWTGTGITGNNFDPSVGTQSITYTVGTSPCDATSTQTITVTNGANASWNLPSGICTASSPIDLNTLITGDTGGTWSGTGVSGSTFDPSVGTQNITYSVGSAPCDDAVTQTITVNATANASWTNPAVICESDGAIDLSTLITGDTGGTWSGTGVTGTSFDPTGLSGNISITYSVGVSPCNASSTQDINVVATPDPSWTPPTGLCAGSGSFDLSTTITGTTGGTWSGTGITGNNFDPSVGTQSITYTVGSGSCQQTSTQTITIDPSADASWTTQSLCISDAPINLNTLITGDTGGNWSGNGVSGTVFDPFFGTQDITYTVGTSGCESSLTQTINVIDLQLTTSVSSVSCFGLNDGQATVTATGGSGSQTYSWNSTPPQTSATATGLAAGTYTVTVTDGSCVVSQDVTIVEPAEIILTMTGMDACEPNLGSASVVALGGVGGFSYNWTPVASTTEVATGIDSTMATVTVTDANGCTATDSVFVNVWNAPTIDIINNDTTIHYGDEIQLIASGGVQYTWTPETDLSCVNCPNPIAEPLENTYYCVSGEDANGCVNSDCITVFVEIVCGDIFVPSAFTPNFDGENDLLCVYSDCIKTMEFKVYNRWGEKVFETNNMNICWDGTWNGKALNSAVFVYTLKGFLINGEPFDQKGNISLIR
ncbi:gliding motility-associated C-terminal domain-containing protein [Paracrocinitomix mangrovi]|uniref:T9SS type B sorting domain-containing protein n=1 Tax=Paracrocinitomix mangrovi TaxID=2862509 RepID=UPI001C8D1346|nr:gliding motility-associated C-terminal domain-containing protein [Paracrocinitomix mangrovi]UKN02909.1 gliding motility-associated C-terminal domain-containing protein [Paracrocinitomix mangrovi]